MGLKLCGVLLLAGCAQVSDLSHTIVASRMYAVAVVDGNLLTGEVSIRTDRTGIVTLAATGNQCVGHLVFTASDAGTIDLRCNRDVVTQLRFTTLSATKGHAYGVHDDTPVSMAYGMSGTEARAYLRLPPNKSLVLTPKGGLELRN